MKALIYLYDDYAEFEISILDTVLRGSGVDVVTCSHLTKGDFVVSSGGLQVVPHLHMDEVDPMDYAVFIIPGGSPHLLLGNIAVRLFMKKVSEARVYLAAICAGPALLADAGLLSDVSFTTSVTPEEEHYAPASFTWENKKQEVVVTDHNITTATGSAYVEFAEEVLRQLGLVERDEQDPLSYFKVPSMS